jgi:hypothetical protein
MFQAWFPRVWKLMRCVKLVWLFGLLLILAVSAGCGGGNSSVTTYTGGGAGVGTPGTTVTVDTPTGINTTEIVVDSGPASFSFGAANIPYVTVTICTPGTSTCVTVDHVFLDTGSYGLRMLKSKVSALSLPALNLAANSQFGTPAGLAVECYPFVLGGLWGPLAKADVRIAGEAAAGIPIQVIDDTASAALAVPADCITASGGSVFSSAASLQANGILGIGMMGFDCGLTCISPLNYAGFHVQYYVCPDSVTANCKPAAMPVDQQVQNPVAHFVPDDRNPQPDNNGTIIVLPELPTLGAGVAKGRLVFGIGTRSNNQISPSAKIILADANPSSSSYLYFKTTLGTSSFVDSYIDSGSNAFFFNDSSISQTCKSSFGGVSGGWYCPAGVTSVARTATLTDSVGNLAPVSFSVGNADLLFSGSSTAFANLGGSINQSPDTFVWGLSFFFGRSVYTSIWGQALSQNGPWNAF